MTFDEWCRQGDVTTDERIEVAWCLAAFRMRRTIETCAYPSVQPAPEPSSATSPPGAEAPAKSDEDDHP